MAYKAEVTQVSDLTVDGYMTVTFKITKGGDTLYQGITVEGLAESIVTKLTEKANALSTQLREAKKVKVGDKFDIEE